MLAKIKQTLRRSGFTPTSVEVTLNAVDLLTIQSMILTVGRAGDTQCDTAALRPLLQGVEQLVTPVRFDISTLEAFLCVLIHAHNLDMVDVTEPVRRIVGRLSDQDPALAGYLLERLAQADADPAIAAQWGIDAGVRVAKTVATLLVSAVDERLEKLN